MNQLTDLHQGDGATCRVVALGNFHLFCVFPFDVAIKNYRYTERIIGICGT